VRGAISLFDAVCVGSLVIIIVSKKQNKKKLTNKYAKNREFSTIVDQKSTETSKSRQKTKLKVKMTHIANKNALRN